ncbi:MAG TPA: hypothetical protein PL045_10990, partial [Chitinophagaceae bacterium]|nr:hypothetical protein [Chitinophagaceae bacterium]
MKKFYAGCQNSVLLQIKSSLYAIKKINFHISHIVSHLNRPAKTAVDLMPPEDPLYDPMEIAG